MGKGKPKMPPGTEQRTQRNALLHPNWLNAFIALLLQPAELALPLGGSSGLFNQGPAQSQSSSQSQSPNQLYSSAVVVQVGIHSVPSVVPLDFPLAG